MTRPLRLEFPGAIYHLTARGDRRENTFLDDADRLTFLDLLAKELRQQQWRRRLAFSLSKSKTAAISGHIKFGFIRYAGRQI